MRGQEPRAPLRPGLLIAKALAGSWRRNVAPLALDEAGLRAITPILLDSGGGALCWRRLRTTPLAATVTGAGLRDAYRVNVKRKGNQGRVISLSDKGR